MARSASLNPASVPFFPGGLRSINDDNNGGVIFNQNIFRSGHGADADGSSIPSLSRASSDYRSVKSSPSPPHENLNNDVTPHYQSPSKPVDIARRSPAFRPFDGKSGLPPRETRAFKDTTLNGSFESFMEGGENRFPSPPAAEGPGHPLRKASFMVPNTHDRLPPHVQPIPVNNNGSPSFLPGGALHTSTSPSSSLDSGSQFSGNDLPQQHAFDTQLRSSPLIRDLLDRLHRYELSSMEIQRDLADVQRNVNMLVERALGVPSKPEFKDPFAPVPPGPGFPMNGHRPSLGNIAPNQSPPSDDITSISQRLNTLTSSVGQLLAIQTQQMQTSHGSSNHAIIGPGQQAGELSSPPLPSHPSILGHGRPPNPRIPNPPMRTWSAGAVDIPPMRPSEPNINALVRPDLSRDKRRSVSSLLRRDSSGLIDPQDNREGPLVSKWEQLQLAPELLRSLSKFGVGPPNKIQQRALPFLLRGSDIIAQAPPTQERIAAYVIPAIQIALTSIAARPSNRGPLVIMISTTVDQATQAQRMIRDLGGPIGIRSALGVGTTSASSDLSQELRLLQQNMPHILCGTPQKLHALFTTPGGLIGSEVRFLVLDEVDQLIARNLHDFVFTIVKLLPSPRSRPAGTTSPSAVATPNVSTPTGQEMNSGQGLQRRFSTVTPNPNESSASPNGPQPERQTALFSNTVPQDVLNLATSIQLREPVRVLVRRDGNPTQPETVQGARGLRQYYLYLAFTAGGGRAEPAQGAGLGIIGSGRGATSAETVQAREWKLDALADLLDDVDVMQAIVHVGGMTALDAVMYKLTSRGIEAVSLHGDMSTPTKLGALNKYRNGNSALRQPGLKVLVVYDVQIKDVPQVPLIINYDLPKAVEEYAHRVSAAIAPNNYSRAGVVVNFVTATGGDVEMLRSIECFYKIKCPEVPMSLRDIV